jgi:hypothetical protein
MGSDMALSPNSVGYYAPAGAADESEASERNAQLDTWVAEGKIDETTAAFFRPVVVSSSNPMADVVWDLLQQAMDAGAIIKATVLESGEIKFEITQEAIGEKRAAAALRLSGAIVGAVSALALGAVAHKMGKASAAKADNPNVNFQDPTTLAAQLGNTVVSAMFTYGAETKDLNAETLESIGQFLTNSIDSFGINELDQTDAILRALERL